MAIRSWSFTKFWSVSVILWLVAAGIANINRYYEGWGLLAAGLGFLPAFLAGAWAGSHPEIGQWPRVRLFSMWTMVLGSIIVLSDTSGWRIPLVLIGAPAAIFTLRWYELTQPPSRIEPPSNPVIPPHTPPGGSLIG
jgi:hypothetical protein